MGNIQSIDPSHVKIFNELEVDELIVLDIDATIKGLSPNEKLISKSNSNL